MSELYDRITDMNNLNHSFLECRKGVFWKQSVQKYDAHRFRNLYKLRKSLIDKTYKQGKLFSFYINERGKVRHIQALHIGDRVLQRTLCDYVLMPELSKYLIYDNPASVKGKGTDFARKRAKQFILSYIYHYGIDGYVLQIDIKNYFGSIPHQQFLNKLKEKINDDNVIWLTENITNDFEGDVGFGIGSQLSQVAGIYYLNDIDTYCKTVKSVKYYERYMDDILIIHNDKDFLKQLLKEIESELASLGLSLNKNKTHIRPLTKQFVFLQMVYGVTKSGKLYIRPCKKSIRRERRKIRKLLKNGIIPFDDILSSYKSWKGNIKKYRSHNMLVNTDHIFRKEFEQWKR